MILEQLYLSCLSQASYLIADEETKVAAVVDPRRDIEIYLEEAERRGLKIEHVLLTHFHADFLAGHLELRDRVGATIHLGAQAKADYPFNALADGDELELGEPGKGVRLKCLETPGHTPESVCYLVYASGGDASPHAVLTGDTLFIGDVGRPDLMASVGVTARELGGMLYKSLQEKLLPLPDETILYPGHGAGSACGKSLSSALSCTIGRQRQLNYALQPMDEERFIDLVAAGQPPAPAYFSYDAQLNKSQHPTLDESLRGLVALSLEQVLAKQGDGAQVLDVRDPADFAQGHLARSVNVGLGGRFAGWAGAVLDPKRPIVVVAPAGKEREAATRLGRVGFDGVVGYLDGGPGAFPAEGVKTTRRYDAAGLAQVLDGDSPPHVLDVRSEGEREEAAIDGSQHIVLTELPGRLDEVPREGELVVVCGGGYRSMIASSLLEGVGVEAADLTGGMRGWVAHHAPAS